MFDVGRAVRVVKLIRLSMDLPDDELETNFFFIHNWSSIFIDEEEKQKSHDTHTDRDLQGACIVRGKQREVKDEENLP